MFQESVLRLGPAKNLIGIHCTSKSKVSVGGAKDLCLIFTNTGIGTRVGPHRFHVELGRRLASDGGGGLASLRFDVSGLGDSPARLTDLPSLERGAEDLQEVMTELKTKFGYKKFILFGNCSASFRALVAGSQSEDSVGLVTYDSYYYSTRMHRFRRIFELIFQWQRWVYRYRRIRLQKKITEEGWTWGVELKNASGESEWPTQQKAEELFRLCAEKGMKQIHYYSEHVDTGFNHAGQFWSMFPSLEKYRDKQISVKYLKGMDHLVSVAEARRIVLDDVFRWIQIQFLTRENSP